MNAPPQAMRLALRVEGDFWNAYLAPMGSMEGAVFLGSLHMALAKNPKLKRGFMKLTQAATEHLLKQVGAEVRPWNQPAPAPESERGSA